MFQDIRMPRKSLREVLPKNGAVIPRASKIKRVMTEDMVPPPPPPPRERAPRRKRHWHFGPKLFWVFIVLIVVVAAGFFISKELATVLVTVAPKHYEVVLNGSAFTAPYESVAIPTLKDDQTVTTKLTTGAPQKAGGVIVVSNNYSAKSQALIATTRFEAANGKIYRLTKAITVPGTKVVGGKTVAGSVEATVVADQAGVAYNIGLTDFKIPGFKGDPRYDKFSAKSLTSMTGGSAGQGWTMAEAEHTQAVTALKQSLLKKAAEQIRFQIPDDFILYDNNITATFKEELASTTLTMSADARAIIFKRDELGKALVTSSLPENNGVPFTVTNLDKLGVTVDANSLKTDDKKLTILAQGKADVELTVDPDILRQKLAGATGAQAKEILGQFPGVAEAQISFRPPWIREFPDKVERIKVLIP